MTACAEWCISYLTLNCSVKHHTHNVTLAMALIEPWKMGRDSIKPLYDHACDWLLETQYPRCRVCRVVVYMYVGVKLSIIWVFKRKRNARNSLLYLHRVESSECDTNVITILNPNYVTERLVKTVDVVGWNNTWDLKAQRRASRFYMSRQRGKCTLQMTGTAEQ